MEVSVNSNTSEENETNSSPKKSDDGSVEDQVQQALKLIATDQLKEAHSKLTTALKLSPTENKLFIESTITKLEQEMNSKTVSLIEQGDDLFKNNQYPQAYEKFKEAHLYTIKDNERATLEDKIDKAFKAATARRLNNEAIEFCNKEEFAAGLDKFEEALDFVENEFLFKTIDENTDIVNRLIIKKYMRDEFGRPKLGEMLMLMQKFTQDVVAGKF